MSASAERANNAPDERHSAPDNDADQAERRAASESDDRVHRFRDQDEQRIAGRMRLMLGDVEVADAEREVDRVEIFERAGRNGR